MKNARIAAIAIVLLIILWVGGNILFKGNQSSEAAGEAASSAAESKTELPIVLMQNSVAQDQHRTLRLFGQTDANRKIDIVAQTSGEVEKISFQLGQTLDAGDVLLELSADNRPWELKQAQASLDNVKAKYASTQELVKKKYRPSNELIAAKAEIALAEASLERISLDMAHMKIKAPFRGIVDSRQVDLGSYVSPGMSVARFLELDPLKITANVSENAIAFIRQNDEATVQIGSDTVKAKISNISRQADDKTRTFRVEFSLDNKKGQYVSGQTAMVILSTEQIKAHLISPAYVSLDEEGRFGVKIVDEQGEVRFIPAILVSDTTEGMWIAGLPDQANIITQGAAYVKAGQKVKAFYTQKEAHEAAMKAKAVAETSKGA